MLSKPGKWFDFRRTKIMDLTKVVATGFTATSTMTVFSYKASTLKRENFREPELLARLVEPFIAVLGPNYARIAGWGIHYSMGVGWSVLY